MEALAVSSVFSSSQHSQISLDGLHIATLEGSRLDVSSLASFQIVRSVAVPQTSAKFVAIKWAPATDGSRFSSRFLLADEDAVHVWDVQDVQWSVKMDNGNGSMGKIANVEFGSDGDEVMVFSTFGGQVTIFSLYGSKSVEIKDAKFVSKGYGRGSASSSGIFALLTRPAAQDVVTLHASSSYATIKTFTVPSVDAQGLKWSPDGRWLAVWDTPANGYKIFIYTADGNLFRTSSGDCFDDGLIGLGVKSVDWSTDGNYLAIAGYDREIVLLTTRTFSPAVHFACKSPLRPTYTNTWQEQVSASAVRSYSLVAQPTTPPAAATSASTTEARPALSISILAFNADGSLLAAKDDSMPTTVWIWDLSAITLRAVLIQHALIKRLSWHPTKQNLLLVQTAQAEAVLYIWNSDLDEPRVIVYPSLHLSSRAEAQWVHSPQSASPAIMYGDTHRGALAWPEGRASPPDATSGMENGFAFNQV